LGYRANKTKRNSPGALSG